MPDKEGRRRLFEKKVPQNAPGRDALDWDRLAELSDSLSGGEILVAVKNACFDAVRRPEQRLTTEIVLAAVSNARIAKAQIGNGGDAIVEVVRKDRVPADEGPAGDAAEAARQNDGDAPERSSNEDFSPEEADRLAKRLV